MVYLCFMKKLKQMEDIERELTRILTEVNEISRNVKEIEEKVEDTSGYRVEPIGSTDLDFEYLKFKARRTLRGNLPPSGSAIVSQ